MNQNLILRISLGLILTGLVVVLAWPATAEPEVPPAPPALAAPSLADYLSHRALDATALAVYDPNQEVLLYGRAAESPRPIASIAKVMTALIAREELPRSSLVPIGLPAILEQGDSGFIVNEEWRLQDLIDFTLVTSSNDGARALADAVALATGREFTELMTERAQKLGLQQTTFSNPTGLDLVAGEESGASSSAHDVARLLAFVLKNQPEVMEATSFSTVVRRSLSGIVHEGRNTNQFISVLPGFLASKTGFTDLAAGNLAFAFDRGLNQPLIVVLLGSGRESRFLEAAEVADGIFKYLVASQEL